ncbi:MAG: cupin domain-containing protein [Rubrobacteraceae bacterium]
MDNGGREIETRKHFFDDDGRIPNNPDLPLLVYPQALDESERDPSQCKELLTGNSWEGAWVDGVFSYHHYHSNAHEVLCMIGGSAQLAFGGPEGETVEVEAGDVVVIPAGVGHKNEDSSGGFSVIGAYPKGQENYDLRTGEEGERPEVLENIGNVALPEKDPLFGGDGSLSRHWSG